MTLKLGRSKIQGMGIFTTQPLERGRQFYKIDETKTSETPREHWAYLNGRWFSDPILNFVNHSCSPNSRIDLEELSLEALENIPAGSEITVDYNLTEDGNKRIECNCGSNQCRGYFLIRS